MLGAALAYADAGLPVVPLHSVKSDGSCTCGNQKCHSPGKHPRTKNGLKDASTDEKQIRQWWSDSHWPNASIAGVGGEFLCLDVDAKSGGQGSLENLIKDNTPLPETAVALTGEYDGQRGSHYWFYVPADRQVASKVGIRKGIDIRCARGYAVLPPSPHASGVNYEWVIPFSEVIEAPEWLVDLAPVAVVGESNWGPNPSFKMSREVRAFLKGTHEIPGGEQRDFLVRAARSILTTGKTVDQTAMLLFEGFDGNGGIGASEATREPWTHEDVLYLVEDVYRKAPTSEMVKDFSTDETYTRDDWGNARRLLDSYPDDSVFHVHEWGVWYMWEPEEKFWKEDDGSTLRLHWQALTKKLWDDSFDSEDKKWAPFLNRSRNRGGTESCVHLARDYVKVSPKELNTDPFLLNCTNGVLDLRKGEFIDSDPALRLTKRITAAYEPTARSKLWDKVLSDLLPDPALRLFVQKIFGYTLTGSVEENKFFYFHGPPAGGKTTLLEIFSILMGNYSESAEPSTFMQGRTESGPTEDIARLAAARMVTSHEVEEGAKWAEARIAHLTGGDKITARFLHQNSFEFYPQFKLFFSANHKPRVSGNSQSGLWRRLIIIPFERTIPEGERDPMLLRKLREPEVLSAILKWAVDGALLWMDDYKAGKLMEVPQVVKDEVSEYKTESDHVLQFTNELLVQVDDDTYRYPKPDLYQLYRSWCDQNGRRQYFTANKFTREIQAQGYEFRNAQYGAGSQKKVRECWVGMKLRGFPQHKM